MPFRRKRKRKFKRKRRFSGGKRRFRRRTGMRHSRVVVRNPFGRGTAGPFPMEYWCTLPFKSNITFNLSSGFTQLQYTPSNLFDPGGTHSANVAKWLNNLNVIYNQWIVGAFKYDITMVNLDSSSAVELLILPWPTKDEVPSSRLELQMSNGCKYSYASSSGGRNVTRQRGFVNVRRLTGTDVFKDDQYWGTQTTQPTKRVELFIGAAALNGSSSSAVQFVITFTFYVKFWQMNLTTDGGAAPSPDLSPTMRNLFLAGKHTPQDIPMGGVSPVNEEKEEMLCDVEGL